MTFCWKIHLLSYALCVCGRGGVMKGERTFYTFVPVTNDEKVDDPKAMT